jgi:hypothetical protein
MVIIIKKVQAHVNPSSGGNESPQVQKIPAVTHSIPTSINTRKYKTKKENVEIK